MTTYIVLCNLLNFEFFFIYRIYLTAHTRVGWCQVPETKGDKNTVDNDGVVYRWRQLHRISPRCVAAVTRTQ